MPAAAAAPFTLAGATSHFLHADATGGDYRLDVFVPATPPPSGGFPLVLLLDGHGCFATAVEAVQRMGRRPDATAVSPLMVAALTAVGDDPLGHRQRDFTSPLAGREGAGGAGAFLAFLHDMVLPLAARLGPVNHQRRTLFGHSLAGYFTLWVLANHPGAFNNYVAISPSVWWDQAGLLATLATLPAAELRVLLCLGEWEEALPPWQQAAAGAEQALARRQARQVRPGMAAITRQLAARLSDARVQFHLLAAEDHASIVSAAIPRMLRLACR